MRSFLPYEHIRDNDAIMVDGSYPRGLVLSHWKGTVTPAGIAEDTSAGIVLNALRKNISGLECQYVTANHFDIDGFIGVWALLYPELALANEDLLKHAAYIGDFREIDFNYKNWQQALKIVCWINKTEKEKFYAPFGMWETEEAEFKACTEKFIYFIEAFEDALLNIDKFKNDWEEEYNKVLKDIEIMKKSAAIEKYPELGLIIITLSEPVHYYTLFSFSIGFDTVLTLYSNNRYELEYKYTTWVDIVSRPVYPRKDLKELAMILNEIEQGQYKWYAPKITDTGPVMRMNDKPLSYAELFESPDNRKIFSSSIEDSELKKIIIRYFASAYKNVQPKQAWTWKEIRKFNNNINLHTYINA